MWVIVIILIVVAVYAVKIFNKLKGYTEDIEQQKSTIDVALNTRYDTIMQMQQAVKGYIGHEADTLIKISGLRSGMSVEEMVESENKMGKAVSQIYAVAENHPQLRASENFIILQKTISSCEDNLQAARRAYNSVVADYNKSIGMFPDMIIANIMKFERATFFEVSENKKDIINLDFSM